MATLYHATTDLLTPGDTLISRASDFPSEPYRRALEELLAKRCPEGRPHRMSSWFACETPRLAAKYLDAQISFGVDKEARKGQPRLYAVEMDPSSKQPMVLVSAVALKLSARESNIASWLADEYWTSTKEWKFWEYISPEIVVVEECSWPDGIELAIALQTYSADASLLKRFLAELSKPQNV
jgi:hypothetical protein